MNYKIPETIRKFASVFTSNGHKLFIVGGAVRDFILGIPNDDFDFTTDATPEEVIKMFPGVIPTGIKHGTVTVVFNKNQYEVTTFRIEDSYTDKRHPDSVNFAKNLEEDLSRRDFTVNAFAADCTEGKITDLFNGMSDLQNKTIRAIGNPSERFEEDALRLMRMCRFCAKLGFNPDERTFESAKKLSENIKYVSSERIFEELRKTLDSKSPETGLKLMYETGLLRHILPEVDILASIPQNKAVASNALEHTFISISAATQRNYSFPIKLALLLHDIGKPLSMIKDENQRVHFPNHDFTGGKIATDVLKRLKCSNKMIQETSILVSNHMVKYSTDWTDGAVKRFINRVGIENVDNLFKLQWCDQIASEGFSREESYREFIDRIEKLKSEPLLIKDLNISGYTLQQLGIPRNNQMGTILNRLLEYVIDKPELNTEDKLKELALSEFRTQNQESPRQA